MDDLRDLLELTTGLAADYYDTLNERPVFPRASYAELRETIASPLPEEPSDPRHVIEALAAAVDPGLVAEGGGPLLRLRDRRRRARVARRGLAHLRLGPERGPLRRRPGGRGGRGGGRRLAARAARPAEQTPRSASSPAGRWRTSPRSPRPGTTCSRNAGWDVERDGLNGAPRIRVIVGEKRHGTIDRSLRMLGLGAPTDIVPADEQGRMLAEPARDRRRSRRSSARRRAR